MRVAQGSIEVETPGASLVDITGQVGSWLGAQGLQTGTLSLFCRHTSAGLLISENADPAVRRDLLAALARMAPENAGYEHDCEGPDDMPAHIKAMLTGSAVAVPFAGGRLLLGTWQAIYLGEFRAAGHRREVVLTAFGD